MERLFVLIILFCISFTALGIPTNSAEMSTLNLEPNLPDSITAPELRQVFIKYDSCNCKNRIEIARQALNLSQQQSNKSYIKKALLMLATEYQIFGNYIKAEMLYKEAIRIDTINTHSPDHICAYLGLGKSLLHQEKLDESLTQLRTALTLSEDLQAPGFICSSLSNIGLVFLKNNDFDLSFDYILRALNIAQKNEDQKNIAHLYQMLGILNAEQGTYLEAIKNLELSVSLAKKHQFETTLYTGYLEMGKVYGRLKQPLKADTLLAKAGDLALQASNWGIALEAYEWLAKSYSYRKNFDQALVFNKLASTLKDSIFTQTKSNVLADMQAVFKISEKEHEVSLRKQEVELHNREERKAQIMTFGLIVIIVLVIAMAILFYFWQQDRIHKNKVLFQKQQEIHSAQHAEMESVLKTNEMERTNLENELKFKHKEVVNYALSVIQKNDYFEEVKSQLQSLVKTEGPNRNKEITSLIRKLNQSFLSTSDLDDMNKNIEKVNHQFVFALQNRFPNLTENERKLCGFLRIGLSNKEIAGIQNISPKAVEMSRYRLRKKINIESNTDLVSFFKNLQYE